MAWLFSTTASSGSGSSEGGAQPDGGVPAPGPGQRIATFGAGCFWCVEAVYERLPGVKHAVSGYMGGHVKNPTYRQVCGGSSGHVEVTQLVFDPAEISYEELLGWFWKLHDPTQKDGQGHDIGPQYRSVIFTHDASQEEAARASKQAAQVKFSKPIATEIRPAAEFYPAEPEHQDYYRINKRNNPYCPAVITPKLKKLGLE